MLRPMDVVDPSVSTVVGTTAATDAAPKSILKKRPLSCTTTTRTHHQHGDEKVSSTGYSRPVTVGLCSDSASVSSCSLRDSLELTKSHRQHPGGVAELPVNGKVCHSVSGIFDVDISCQLI